VHSNANGTAADAAELFDGLIVTTPAAAASSLIRPTHGALAEALQQIETAGCAVVVLALDQQQLSVPFQGFGIVVPSCLQRKMIAVSAASNKFAGRAPAGKLLLRCFLGGALQPELVDQSDEQLLSLCRKELANLLPFRGEPEFSRVIRWRNAMPQYHVGHLNRVEQIESWVAELPNFQLAGNSYQGVGIPVCISSGWTAALSVLDKLSRS
jgi:oxygen-dependent protoporphyrinogen oxidase